MKNPSVSCRVFLFDVTPCATKVYVGVPDGILYLHEHLFVFAGTTCVLRPPCRFFSFVLEAPSFSRASPIKGKGTRTSSHPYEIKISILVYPAKQFLLGLEKRCSFFVVSPSFGGLQSIDTSCTRQRRRHTAGHTHQVEKSVGMLLLKLVRTRHAHCVYSPCHVCVHLLPSRERAAGRSLEVSMQALARSH